MNQNQNPVTALRAAEESRIQAIKATTAAVNAIGEGLADAVSDLSAAVLNCKLRHALAEQTIHDELAGLLAFLNGQTDATLTDLGGGSHEIAAPVQHQLTVTPTQTATEQPAPIENVVIPVESTVPEVVVQQMAGNGPLTASEPETSPEVVPTPAAIPETAQTQEEAETVMATAANPPITESPAPVLTPSLEGRLVPGNEEVLADAGESAPKPKLRGKGKRR